MPQKKTGHTLLDVWNYLQRLSLEPMNPFPLLASNTFKKNESTALVCWDINCLQLSAMAANNIHTQLVCFFWLPTHDFTQWQCQAMSGKPQRLKDFFPKWNHLGVMSWPSGKFQSPRMSQWRWWAIAASRIPCWCPSPSKKNGGNWSHLREVQHGFGRCFV